MSGLDLKRLDICDLFTNASKKTMTDEPPITQIGASVVISGPALPLLYRATLALIARRHRDGLAASSLLQQARTTLYRACMSAQRRKGAAYHLASHAATASAVLRTRKLPNGGLPRGVSPGQGR